MPSLMEINTAGALMDKRRFVWNIRKFLEIRGSDELLKTQEFQFAIGSKIGLPVKLKCYLLPYDDPDSGKRWAGVYLKLLDKPADVERVIIRFGMKACSYVYSEFFTADFVEDDWGVPDGIPLEDWKLTYLLYLNVNGSMPIHLKVTLFNFQNTVNPGKESALSALKTQYQAKFYAKIARDLEEMTKYPDLEPSCPNIKLVSEDGVRFEAKKALLAVRSPTLRSYRSRRGSICLAKGLHSESLGVLIHFLNTGTLHDAWRKEDVIAELTSAAHTCLLTDLKEFLDQVLALVCTKNNAGELLILARKLGMEKAKKDLTEFVKNYFDEELLDQIVSAVELGESKKKEDAGMFNKFQQIIRF